MNPLRTGGRELKENRRHGRVHSRARCWCEGENVTFYARVGNLSEGGMFLRTSTPLAVGAQAKLRFEVPGGLQIEAQAKVIWSRGEGEVGPPGMGLHFVSMGTGVLDGLRAAIARELAAKHSKD